MLRAPFSIAGRLMATQLSSVLELNQIAEDEMEISFLTRPLKVDYWLSSPEEHQ